MMQFEIFVGIDWSAKVHQVAVADAAGEVLGEQAFARSGDGLAAMADWILERESESEGRAAVAIEKPHGPEANALLERGIAVFAPDPKQLDRFHDLRPDRRRGRPCKAAAMTDCLHRGSPFVRFQSRTGWETRALSSTAA